MNNWGINGSTLPSGSYMTSSVLIYKNTVNIDDKTQFNIIQSSYNIAHENICKKLAPSTMRNPGH
jgi:hypothetical protein